MATQTWEIDVGDVPHREIVKNSDGGSFSITCQNTPSQGNYRGGDAKQHPAKPGNNEKKKKSKSGPGADKVKLCDFWKRNGECKFQDKCFFSHDADSRGVPKDDKSDKSWEDNSRTPEKISVEKLNLTDDEYLNITSSNTKTCQFFSTQNGCKFGDNCSFTHYRSVGDAAKEEELEMTADDQPPPPQAANPRVCVFFKKARGCAKGDQCDFSHVLKEDVKKKPAHAPTRTVVATAPAEMDTNSEYAKETLDHPFMEHNSNSTNQKTPKACRFFAMSRGCRMKDKCPFLHDATKLSNMDKNWRKNSAEPPPPHVVESNSENDNNWRASEPIADELPNNDNEKLYPDGGGEVDQNVCRFYLTPKGCFRGEKCTFQHPEANVVEGQSDAGGYLDLQQREFKQLEKRFSADKCTLIQSEGSRIYSIVFEPSDPDWGIVVKEFELVVEFPPTYPEQMFNITLKDKEIYPERFTK
jgi:hypothetical protein